MRSNRAPFTDICQLISIERQPDGDGYHTTDEIKREIFCSVSDGVNRAEYFEAMKAGVKLSATIEVNEGDYEKEQLLEHEGTRYKVERVYPTGYGTLELSCSEVVR